MSNQAPNTADAKKLEDFQKRVRTDAAFRDSILNDRRILLDHFGIDAGVVGAGRPAAVGQGDNLRIVLVTDVASDAAAAADDFKWPYRYYYLFNSSNRELNLESWRHIAGIGSQEHAIAVAAGESSAFGLATLEELIWNQCNLSNNSHLVRDNTNNKVLGESWNVTCGNVVNRWDASGSDDAIKVVESHPSMDAAAAA